VVRNHRPELLAALGLLCVYLAVMNGHLNSIDGLVMWRQALSITYHHSLTFVPPIWWGSVITTSSRGLGASLQYVPSLLLFPWLAGHVPAPPPSNYDFKLFYGDILYAVAGAPLWAALTAVTAYLVYLTASALAIGRTEALWAMVFFGLGSPAFAASRGDTPQPLIALFWVLGVYACLRYMSAPGRRWLWIAGASLFYGVLARPLEGSLLLPGVLLLLLPVARKHPIVPAGQVGAWMVGVIATLLVNWARFGSALNFGYGSQVAWSTPIWVGLPGAVLSPGRGVLWEFPALGLAVVGAVYMWRTGRRLQAAALGGVPAVLLIEACQYFDWVGGWDWGFRFFQPALPLVAALAGVGVVTLPRGLKTWLPAVLLAGGILWNIPTVTTDILAGYGPAYADPAANWRLDAYPPIGAWRFVHHLLPRTGADSAGIDNVWLRATLLIGKVALAGPVVLLGAALALGRSVLMAERAPARVRG
jgi:hypothetical protein